MPMLARGLLPYHHMTPRARARVRAAATRAAEGTVHELSEPGEKSPDVPSEHLAVIFHALLGLTTEITLLLAVQCTEVCHHHQPPPLHLTEFLDFLHREFDHTLASGDGALAQRTTAADTALSALASSKGTRARSEDTGMVFVDSRVDRVISIPCPAPVHGSPQR